MECARISAAFKPLELASLPVPPCPDDGILLRTLYAGVCHSDLHYIDDEIDVGNGNVFRHRDVMGNDYKGLILGHEISGEIIEIGKGVPHSDCHLREGDTVIVYPWRGCRNCEACGEGESQLCEDNKHGTTDIGQGLNGGGFGSYVAVPDWNLAVRLPKNIDPMVGCMLPCSAVTAYHAIQKARPSLDLAVRIRGFANLLVIGAGGVGMWTVMLVKSVFGDQNVRVLCADTQEEKLKVATHLGADDALRWEDNSTVEELVDLTTMSGYNKVDAAIDYVGSCRTCSAAVRSLHHGGMVICVGLQGGELGVSIPELISKSISLIGLRTASMRMLRNLVELLSVTQPDNYPPTQLITLKEINSTLDRMRKHTLKGRAIIKHEHKEHL